MICHPFQGGHLIHRLGELLQIIDVDDQAVPEHLVGHVHKHLLGAASQVFLLGLFPADKLHRGHVVDLFDLGLQLGNLFIGIVLVDVGVKDVFTLQLAHHLVGVQGQQTKGAHDNEASHNHAHSGKGHQPVGEDAVKSLADKISKVGSPFSHSL